MINIKPGDLKASRMWGRSRGQSRDRLKASYHSLPKWTTPLIIDIHLVQAFYSLCLQMTQSYAKRDQGRRNMGRLLWWHRQNDYASKNNPKKSCESLVIVWNGGSAVRAAASQHTEFAWSPHVSLDSLFLKRNINVSLIVKKMLMANNNVTFTSIV